MHSPLMLALSGEHPDMTLFKAFRGVGMIRGEYVMRHCGHYIHTELGRKWMASYLRAIASAFAPRPVWYRLSDFEPREIATLVGSNPDDDRSNDENPLLAPRGLRRGLLRPEALKKELQVVSDVAENWKNLHLLFSMVGSRAELRAGIELARSLGFRNQVGTMIETPSAAFDGNILATEVDLFVVGLNDLTSFFFAAERNSTFAQKDHPLIKELLKSIQAAARKHRIPIWIAGDMDQALLQWVDALDFDAVVVHYSSLPKLLKWNSDTLRDIGLVRRLKREMISSLQAGALKCIS